MRITATDVALVANGTLIGPGVDANGISFDSRQIVPGSAFVAIVAQRDGHQFVADAVAGGASFLIVERGRSVDGVTCVEVDDTVAALAKIAAHCRQRFTDAGGQCVVGITGSVGKTTTKAFVAAVLARGFFRVHAAESSFNNDIGVPVSIINAPDGCEAMVLEMGMRGFGEIARLCEYAQPTIAVITVIGDAHSERVGGRDGIIRAKGELIEALDEDGIAVLNADDSGAMSLEDRCAGRVITYGGALSADVGYEITDRDDTGCATVDFSFDGETATTTLTLPGDHMASNAAAAVAVGIASAMLLAECVGGLNDVQGATGRMRWMTSRQGIRILDDSYNANTVSMTAALDTISLVPAVRRVAVLGAMAELSDMEESHRRIEMYALSLGIEVLPLETDLYGACALSMEEVMAALEELTSDDVVVVKGSRSSATQRVVAALLG